MFTSQAEVSPATLSQSTRGLGAGRSWWMCVSEHPFPPTPACPPAWSRGPSPRRSLSSWTELVPSPMAWPETGDVKRIQARSLPLPSSSDVLAFFGIVGSWYHFQLRSGPVWAGGEEEKGRRQKQRETERNREREKQKEMEADRERDKQFILVQFTRSVVSDSLQPYGLQHARPPCPSPPPGVCSNSCPSSR